MADNTVLNLGSGGDTIVTEQPGGTGAKIPVSKIYTGAADVNGGPVTQTNPLFVELSDGTNALGAAAHPVRTDPTGTTTQPVSVAGTVAISAASLPLPSGAATDGTDITGATMPTGGAGLRGWLSAIWKLLPSSIGQKAKAASLSVAIASDQDALAVSGTVSVSSLPGTTNAGLTAKTSDFDTGGGVDTVAMFGVALPASGGAVVGGTNTNPLRTDPVGTTTQPVSIAATITAVLAAGTALIGAVASALRTDSIMSGTTSLTPKFAKATLSATGEVVALVSSKKIRVLRYSLMADAACSVSFKSHTAGQISGTKYLSANGGAGGTFCPVGHFETTSGEALDLTITGSANVSVDVSYIEV